MSTTPTRDNPEYWQARPSDHNALGLFVDGPQPAEPITNRLARLTRSRCEAVAEGPSGARQRMERERQRRLRVIEARAAFVRNLANPGAFVRDKSRRWQVRVA